MALPVPCMVTFPHPKAFDPIFTDCCIRREVVFSQVAPRAISFGLLVHWTMFADEIEAATDLWQTHLLTIFLVQLAACMLRTRDAIGGANGPYWSAAAHTRLFLVDNLYRMHWKLSNEIPVSKAVKPFTKP